MSRSYNGQLETVEGHLRLVKSDMDCQLNSRIKSEYLGKIHFEKPFVSVDQKTIMFGSLALVETHFDKIFIIASIIAS